MAGEDDKRGEQKPERGPGWWPEERPAAEQERRPGSERRGSASGEGPAERAEAESEAARPAKGSGSSAPRPSVGGRYTMFVGAAFLVVIVVGFVNLIGNEDAGILGDRVDRGSRLAAFAVPDVRGPVDADANVAQDDCESSAEPCPEEDLRTPACEIDPEGALRICDFFDKPLAISFWFTRGGDCLPTQDAFDAVAAARGEQVNFLSINVRDDREKVREIIDERGWQVPVGWDRDGAVSNLYRVGGCPTIVLARPGGILQDARIGAAGEEEVEAMIDQLLRASRLD